MKPSCPPGACPITWIPPVPGTDDRPSFPPVQLAEDYRTLSATIEALANAWITDQTPSMDAGLRLSVDARAALARLAVAAKVPRP